ncbi:ABC transporter substrate-binding protein [Subtercola boreus]|uniref:ABC transporter substrate-binding protein n=2 Tax=Subtercola boreus TaxID=120213 RepID=A0A3E0WBJ5_9MICO|nr:ABC transporter substrate-binding protein [Subtercola boreus]RFA20938.1 ABC transporter substrate-binding protein [Subtercola boreus]RFA27131.1 ABC transporter substrate-binding protein [Subtercola boreus]
MQMKKIHAKVAVVSLAAILSAAALSGCVEQAGGGTASTSGAYKIAFLMPDLASTRYEQQDKPLFEAKVKELCADCTVLYSNANASADTQQQQANSAIAQGVNAIVIDAVDSTAAAGIVVAANAASIPIIAYDRPIPTQKADYYVSFDNEGIGKAIAQSLVDKVKATDPAGSILIVNGSPTDAAAGLIKKGIHEAVDSSGLTVLAEFDTPAWDPAQAQNWASGQITQFGTKINGVVAANDGTGGGVIAAFKAAGTSPVPPVTGNDAEVAAAQRILAGTQYNTISKPISIVADAAAEVAYSFAQGTKVDGKATLYDTPSQLFNPDVVTLDNIKEILFDSKIMTAAEVCTGEYAAACTTAGIQ